MSVLDKIDEMLLSEAGGLRGFKNKKALGLEIEGMAMDVEAKDEKKFNAILNSALKKIDDELSVVDAIMRLKDKDAMTLYDRLSDLHYMD